MFAKRYIPYLPITPSRPIPPRNLRVRVPAPPIASSISGT